MQRVHGYGTQSPVWGERRIVSRRPAQGMTSASRRKGSTMLNKKSTTTVTETESRFSTAGASRSPATRRDVTHEQVARRAYEIFKSGTGGTPEDNWFRAERELRARA